MPQAHIPLQYFLKSMVYVNSRLFFAKSNFGKLILDIFFVHFEKAKSVFGKKTCKIDILS